MIPSDLRTPNLHRRENEIGRKIADALPAAHVRRVIFLSGTSAHLREHAGSAMGVAMMEERLNHLRIPELVHLRGTFFMEYLLQGVRQVVEAGVFWAFRPDRSTPMVAAADVGERAAELLTACSSPESLVHEVLGPRITRSRRRHGFSATQSADRTFATSTSRTTKPDTR